MPLPVLILLLATVLAFAIPMWVLLPKFGHNPWFAVLCILVPAGPIVLLWMLAFTRPAGGDADGN